MISLRNIGLGSIVLPVVMMMAGCQTVGDSAFFSTGDVTKPASEQAFQVASIKNSNAIHELVRAAVGSSRKTNLMKHRGLPMWR